MRTIFLLIISNTFMTFAWYGHLKHRAWPLWLAILTSWLIAAAEYCFAVPANRLGYGTFSLAQLKVIQEVVTLAVFSLFTVLYMKEPWRWNYVPAFFCLLGAVYFAFRR
jgi:uncharacterized protein (DUF486 family)